MPGRVENFREVDSIKNSPTTRPTFVKPIRNELREITDLIKSRPFRAETGLAGESMELYSRKKNRRDRMIRSKIFETQELREIGWKEAGESRGFPILWMVIL